MERLTFKESGCVHYERKSVRVTNTQLLDKFGEYEELEEQKRLLKLEDKYQKLMIGEDIFIVDDSVLTGKICKINEWWNDYHGFQGEYVAIVRGGNYKFTYEDFGKTVFLTQEEAEAMLKGIGFKDITEREGVEKEE